MAKTLHGVVSSDRGDKTIVVTVATRMTHPIYKKQYTVSHKFMAHDEQNEAKIGDKVVIGESRPISARKRFMLLEVTSRAIIRHTEEEPDMTKTTKAEDKKQTAATVEKKR